MSVDSQKSHPLSWVSPYITVKNVDSAAEFYQKAFQFNLSEIKPGEDETSIHAELKYREQYILIGKEGAYGSPLKSPLTSGIGCPITLCIYVDNVDRFYKEALDQGAQSISAPEDTFWEHRMCRLQDPDHYTWCFITPLRDD